MNADLRIIRAGRDGSFNVPYSVPSILAGREMIKRDSSSDASSKYTYMLIDTSNDRCLASAFKGQVCPGIPDFRELVEYSLDGKADQKRYPVTHLMNIEALQARLDKAGL